MAHTIIIRGIPGNTQVTEVNVRLAPSVKGGLAFRVPIGATATASAWTLDRDGAKLGTQTYKWFFVTFPDGRQGYVRDDLIELEGDLAFLGYGNYPTRTFAFPAGTNVTAMPSQPAPSQPAQPTTPPPATVNVPPPPVVVPPAQPAPSQPAPSQPAQPTTPPPTTVEVPPPPVVAPPAQPATPPAQPAQPAAQTCAANVKNNTSANVRGEPSVRGNRVVQLAPGTPVTIVGAASGTDGQPYRWAQITSAQGNGFIREDLLQFTDACNVFGFKNNDDDAATSAANAARPVTDVGKLPSVIRARYVITQGFVAPHKGIDIGAPVGTPIYAAGNAKVLYTVRCTYCTDDRPNFAAHGIGHWDSAAVNDKNWGYGFGHYICVQYAWPDIPNAMRDEMSSRGFAGGYINAIFAHLHRIEVSDGQVVTPDTIVGRLGNTGNSTGPHLHLECRVALSQNERSIRERVFLSPSLMFSL